MKLMNLNIFLCNLALFISSNNSYADSTPYEIKIVCSIISADVVPNEKQNPAAGYYTTLDNIHYGALDHYNYSNTILFDNYLNKCLHLKLSNEPSLREHMSGSEVVTRSEIDIFKKFDYINDLTKSYYSYLKTMNGVTPKTDIDGMEILDISKSTNAREAAHKLKDLVFVSVQLHYTSDTSGLVSSYPVFENTQYTNLIEKLQTYIKQQTLE
jgi:hypothetical protein